MKVVLSFIFYPMAIGRFFERALKRRDDIELFTVGPYTRNWIPWNSGMFVSDKYALPPSLPLPFSMGANLVKYPIEAIESQVPFKPDLWLQIDAGWHFPGKPTNGLNFIVGTDPHVLNYDQQRKNADKFFCMQTPYAQSGDVWLPYAYDPKVHYPEEVTREFDVSLIGLHYPERNELMDSLKRQGIKALYDIGPIFDEYRQAVCKAPIGLNWSSRQDLTARVFELMAMKRIPIANNVPDLHKLFTVNRDVVIFDSKAQAVEKAIYYLENEKETLRTSEAAYKAIEGHTWDKRIEQILDYADKAN